MAYLDSDGLSRLWSKVKDLFNLKLNKTDVVNNLTTTTTGKALDATQGKILNEDKPLWLDCGTVSSLPKTVSNAKITAAMVCSHAELGTPSAQTSDWTVTTAAGSVTISGSITGSTTLKMLLVKSQ